MPAAVSNTKPAPRVTQRRRACARCLWGGGAARELASARAVRAGCGRLRALRRRRAGERPLSFGARPWCDVPAAASSAKPAPRVTQRRRACARCLWGGGAALELSCARAVPRWLWSVSCLESATCRREASLLRRAPVVRRASCGLQRQASAACHAAQRALRSLSLGRRRSTRACCARAPCCAGCGRPMPTRRALRRREASLLRRAPWCDVPAAASNAKPAPRVTQRTRTCARCLWGGGAALELVARAPCRAGCGRPCL